MTTLADLLPNTDPVLDALDFELATIAAQSAVELDAVRRHKKVSLKALPRLRKLIENTARRGFAGQSEILQISQTGATESSPIVDPICVDMLRGVLSNVPGEPVKTVADIGSRLGEMATWLGDLNLYQGKIEIAQDFCVALSRGAMQEYTRFAGSPSRN